jgi:PDZ domain
MTRHLFFLVFRASPIRSLFAAIALACVFGSAAVTNGQRGASMRSQARAQRFLPPVAIAGPAAPLRKSPHLTYLPAARQPLPVMRRGPQLQRQAHFVSTRNRHFPRQAFRFTPRSHVPSDGFFPFAFGYWPWWDWDSDSESQCNSYDANGNCYDAQSSSGGTLESADDQQRPMIVVYLRDGSGYGASDYWVTNGMLHIATTYGAQKVFPMEQVDLERTARENAQRDVNFTFYTYPMISDPGPVLAPDSYAPPCPAGSSRAPQTQSASPVNGEDLFGASGNASEKGLVISSVRAGSPAAQAGLQTGDVVVRADCRPIRNAQDIDSAFASSNGAIWVSYLIQGAWMTDKKIAR